MVAQIGGLSGKFPKIFKCTGATLSSSLVFYDNPGPWVVYSVPHGTMCEGLR